MIKSKKYVLVALLLFVASLCLFLGMTNLGSVKSANADGSFVMESGASVRLVPGESGISFLAKVPEPTQDNDREYRMLIVPEKLLTDKKIENDFVNKLKANYPEQAANWDVNFWDKAVTPYYHKQLSTYVVSGALGVSDAHHNIKFCGIAYYMDGNNYVYASYNEAETIFDNARSISLTASLVLNEDIGYDTDEKDILRNYVSSALSSEKLTFSSEFVSAKINSVIDAKLNTISDLDVQYEVGDENIASVENGVITMIGHGSTTVTATIGDQFSTSITVDCPTMNQVLMDATAKSKQINQYYVMGSVATEADANAPEGFKDGLKYVITPTEVVDSGNYYGFPVSLNKNNTKSSAYKDFFSVTDWKNAYVTFKVYNDGTVPVEIGLTQGMTNDKHYLVSSTEKVSVDVAKEKVVYFSIKDAMGLTGSPFDTEDFKAGRGFNIQTKNVISGLTADTLVDGAQTLYITDFDIITPTNDELVRSELLHKFVKAGSDGNGAPYRYHFGLLTESVSTEVKKETEASIKYVMTPISSSNASRYAAVVKLLKAELTTIATIQECESFDTAYIGFWIKNDFNVDLDVKIYSASDFDINTASLSTTKVKNTDGWVYVEVSIASILSDLNKGNGFAISFYYGTGKAAIENGATFYMDGFKIYNKEEITETNLNNAIVNNAQGDSNVTAEVITDAQHLRDSSQSAIKYTLTNDGTKRTGYYTTDTGNIILDDTGILFDLYKDKITDWENAYVGFYIKNDSNYTLQVAPRFQTAIGDGSSKQWQGTILHYNWYNGKVAINKNTSWTYVEMSLKDIKDAVDKMAGQAEKGFYTENLTDFKFCLAISGHNTIAEGASATFYIDGISIYNK